MPFIRPTLDTITQRILSDIQSRLTGGATLLRFALLKILGKVFAGAIHTVFGYIDFLSLQILPDKATGEFLDRHAVSWQLERIQATFASGDITFTGTDGTTIPTGTIVVRGDGYEYELQADGTISGGTVDILVQCQSSGEAGNTDSGVELTLLSPITGVDDSCIVSSGGIAGGLDIEDDESLRARVLHRIRNTPAGGSESDYKGVSIAVSGVENAYVFGNYNGLAALDGHVTVVVLGDSPKVPGAGIITNVQNACDDIKPVTATIHVIPITEGDLILNISITPNTTALQAAVEAEIESLFSIKGIPGGTIYISHLRNAIINGGVDNYEITQIQLNTVVQPIDDINLADYDFPILDSINFATL